LEIIHSGAVNTTIEPHPVSVIEWIPIGERASEYGKRTMYGVFGPPAYVGGIRQATHWAEMPREAIVLRGESDEQQ